MALFRRICLVIAFVMVGWMSFADGGAKLANALKEFGLAYQRDGNDILVTDEEHIDEAARYVASVIRAIELLEAAGLSFDNVRYTAEAPNAFTYSTTHGLMWAPPIDSQLAPSGVIFTRIKEPAVQQNPGRFAWLVPEEGGETIHHWTIPSQEAKGLPEPVGYDWRYGRIKDVPGEYDWYVPQEWKHGAPGNFTWQSRELQYDLTVNEALRKYYSSSTDFEKAEIVSNLVVESFVSQPPRAVP